MLPFDKALDAISGIDVERLIDEKVRESLHLEYKSETYGNSTADHREFLKDVTAMANAYGGYLVIGIKDDGHGIPAGITPVSNAAQDVDRLTKVAWASIDPRISGLGLRTVSTAKGEAVLVRVPRSGGAPHMVLLGANCFWRRHDTNNLVMSTAELGDAFELATGKYERGRDYAALREKEALTYPLAKPAIFIGFMPLLSYTRPIEPSEEWAQQLLATPPNQPAQPPRLDAGLEPARPDYEEMVRPALVGLVRESPKYRFDLPRVELHRNGYMSMRASNMTIEWSAETGQELDLRTIAGYVVGFSRMFRVLCERIGFDGEAVWYAALRHVSGLLLRNRLYKESYLYARRDSSVPRPEADVATGLQPCSTGEPRDATARRLMDMLYNAWGFERAPMFNDAGYDPNWTQ